jgi:predicted component of type VI protein secretion system
VVLVRGSGRRQAAPAASRPIAAATPSPTHLQEAVEDDIGQVLNTVSESLRLIQNHCKTVEQNLPRLRELLKIQLAASSRARKGPGLKSRTRYQSRLKA